MAGRREHPAGRAEGPCATAPVSPVRALRVADGCRGTSGLGSSGPCVRGAQLSYPPSFAPLSGDAGTVSAAVRDTRGKFLAYVNATPRQGDERLKGFGAFRVGLLRHEDPTVIEEAAREGLAFRGGHGSCVIDHYVTRIDHNRYREVACLAQGRHASAVVVAAATEATWRQFEPVLRQVIASFAVR
jgi:hypothetical protein